MGNKIGIVTVLYNSEHVLKDFFETLNMQTYKTFTLYIVDNSSTDNSLAVSKQLSTSVNFVTRFFPQDYNCGVAKGNNIGIEAALKDDCDYVILSNNDIVLEKNTIESLLKGLEKTQSTMAVPKIYYWNSPHILWLAGGTINMRDASVVHFGDEEEDIGQFDIDKEITYAPTCFMLIKSGVFSRVGLMDERYFVYYDDTDFVWRSIKEHKEKLYYIYESHLYHKVSSSTGGGMSDFSIRYMSRNRIIFIRKHFTLINRIFAYCYLFMRYLVKDRWRLTKNQRIVLLRGYLEGKGLYLS